MHVEMPRLEQIATRYQDMVSHLLVAVAVINSGATSGTKSDTIIEFFRDQRFPLSSVSADRPNGNGADYVRRNCLVSYKCPFSSFLGMELRGASLHFLKSFLNPNLPSPNQEKTRGQRCQQIRWKSRRVQVDIFTDTHPFIITRSLWSLCTVISSTFLKQPNSSHVNSHLRLFNSQHKAPRLGCSDHFDHD